MYGLIPFDFDKMLSPWDAFAGFFTDSMSADTCRTDIREDEDAFVIESELPGFDKDDITIDVSDGLLTLKAVHSTDNSEKDSCGRYIRRERTVGTYTRSFDLSGADPDNITASYKNGVLTMRLPKKQAEEQSVKRLQIN